MACKKLNLKVRINKANDQINLSLPKREFSKDELNTIQKKGSVKIFMEDFDE